MSDFDLTESLRASERVFEAEGKIRSAEEMMKVYLSAITTSQQQIDEARKDMASLLMELRLSRAQQLRKVTKERDELLEEIQQYRSLRSGKAPEPFDLEKTKMHCSECGQRLGAFHAPTCGKRDQTTPTVVEDDCVEEKEEPDKESRRWSCRHCGKALHSNHKSSCRLRPQRTVVWKEDCVPHD